MSSNKKCFCFIRHAITTAERAAAKKALEHARRTGDAIGITIGMAALSGKCPAKLRACSRSKARR